MERKKEKYRFVLYQPTPHYFSIHFIYPLVCVCIYMYALSIHTVCTLFVVTILQQQQKEKHIMRRLRRTKHFQQEKNTIIAFNRIKQEQKNRIRNLFFSFITLIDYNIYILYCNPNSACYICSCFHFIWVSSILWLLCFSALLTLSFVCSASFMLLSYK